MKWTDVYDIADALETDYPETEIMRLTFPKLKDMVIKLSDFDDEPQNANEQVLQKIQKVWVKQREDDESMDDDEEDED